MSVLRGSMHGWALVVLVAMATLRWSAAAPTPLLNAAGFVARNISFADVRETTCGHACECTATNCPHNLGLFHATVPEYSNGQPTGRSETMAMLASTIGSPTAIIAHCGKRAQCRLSMLDVTTEENFWVGVLQNEEYWRTRDPALPVEHDKPLLTFAEPGSEDVFAVALQLDELVEFQDRDHDGIYKPDVDRVLSRLHLGRLAWRPGFYETTRLVDAAGTESQIHSFNVTSVDGKVSLRFETATRPDSPLPNSQFSELGDVQLRTPNSTRVVLQVDDFVYSDPRARLAVKAFFVAPEDPATSTHLFGRQLLVVDRHTMQRKAYAGFSPVALVEAGSGPLADRGLSVQSVQASPLQEPFPGELSYSLAHAMQTGTGATRKWVTYFTFSGGAFAPRRTLWDVSLGYGEPPARIHDEFWAGAVLLVLGFATLVLIIVNAGVHLRSRRARRGRSERAT